MTKKRVALDRLRQLRSEANGITYAWSETEQFESWRHNVDSALRVIFGDSGRYVNEFRDINWTPMVYYSGQSNDDWRQSFVSGLSRANGLLTSAIQTAQDYEIGGAEASRTQTGPFDTDSDLSQSSLQAVIVREVSGWPRAARMVVLIAVVLALALYFAWKSLPDDMKRELVRVSPAHEAPVLTNTPPIWVAPGVPIMALSDQVVVSVRSASNLDESAEFHLSIESTAAWHRLRVGQQYRLSIRNREYALTLLQVVEPRARVQLNAVL